MMSRRTFIWARYGGAANRPQPAHACVLSPGHRRAGQALGLGARVEVAGDEVASEDDGHGLDLGARAGVADEFPCPVIPAGSKKVSWPSRGKTSSAHWMWTRAGAVTRSASLAMRSGASRPSCRAAPCRRPNLPKTTQRSWPPTAAAKGRQTASPWNMPTYPRLVVSTRLSAPRASTAARKSSAIRSRTTSIPSAAMRACYSSAVKGEITRSPW